MQESVMSGDTGSQPRHRHRIGLVLALAVLLVGAACGNDDEKAAQEEPEQKTAQLATEKAGGISEDKLPPGFEPAPMVTIDGQQFKMDTIPGHYWKALDNGYAVGLHFQSEQPFKWAQDAGDNELLYLVYAIPGTCKGLNFTAGLKSAESTPGGAPPPRFDHWHGLLGDKGAGEKGHWLMHLPVRDFTFAGMAGNPFDGKKISITNNDPWFMPVCEPAMAENPAMQMGTK
ncbi:MAG: hypothetical protein AB1679_16460 [Actinomycetota bacterium]|jgi:hypothetical protein